MIITLIVALTVVLVVAIGAVAMVLSSRSTPEAVASASVNEVAPAPVATPGSVSASSTPATSPPAASPETAPVEKQAPSPVTTTAAPQTAQPPVAAAPAPTSVPVQPVAPPAPAPAPSPTPIVCPTGGLVLRYVGMTESWLSQASLASDSWSLEATATLTNETGQTLSSVAVSGITIRTQQVIFTGRNTVGLFPTSDAGRVLEPGASLQLTGTSQVSVATDADYSEEARRTPTQRAWEWESVFVSSQFADNAVRSACPRPQVIAEPF